MATLHTSGLSLISEQVDNNFNVKTYTEEMLNAITNPMADLSKTIEAYQYFTALYNGQDFTTGSGTRLNFSNLSPDIKEMLHNKVTEMLKDYNSIDVCYDGPMYGDKTLLLNSDGTPASLLDIVSHPDATYHIKYTISYDDFTSGYMNPSWAPNETQQFETADGCMKDVAWGATDNFAVGDTSKYNLNASVYAHCSPDLKFDISGKATDWEKSGALLPSPFKSEQATDDANALEKFLQKHL